MSLRLHKEHGVNPTISQCILCGKDKNEIVLLGASYKSQAPMHMVTGLEPCETCRIEHLSRGVLLVEAEEQIVRGKVHRVPTGRCVVLKDEAFQRVFNVAIPARKICEVEVGVFEKIGVNP